MEFEWDENKNRSNFVKHGIRFQDAIRVFADPFYQSDQDRHVGGEERWQTIGLVELVGLVIVAHTVRDEDGEREIIRIISARRAERGERQTYEEGTAR
ncbi:MAG: BrnT family toxin [Devosia sp.]